MKRARWNWRLAVTVACVTGGVLRVRAPRNSFGHSGL